MNSEVIKGRVAQLETAVNQSTQNHFVLTGQLQEAKVVLEEMLKEEATANDIIEASNDAGEVAPNEVQ
jgi:hypothetical protein